MLYYCKHELEYLVFQIFVHQTKLNFNTEYAEVVDTNLDLSRECELFLGRDTSLTS